MEEFDTRATTVFYHELGHFVAHILNQKYFEGHGVESMTLTRYSTEWGVQYEGGVTPKKSEEFVPDAIPPIERLAQCIASVLYGCIFQQWFEYAQWKSATIHPKDCLNDNGRDDNQKWHDWLSKNKGHGIDVFYKIQMLIEQHFNKLKGKEEINKFFKNIHPRTYSIATETGYHINKEKLGEDAALLINGHANSYTDFVKTIQSIIDDYQKKKQEDSVE